MVNRSGASDGTISLASFIVVALSVALYTVWIVSRG